MLCAKWLRVCNNFGKFVSALAQRNPLMLLITADNHSQECRIISNSSWHAINPREFKKQNQGVQHLLCGKWLRVCNNFGKFVSALAQRNPLMLLITADDLQSGVQTTFKIAVGSFEPLGKYS